MSGGASSSTGGFTIEDYYLSDYEDEATGAGASREEDVEEVEQPLPLSIHAEVSKKLKNKLDAYYALNRRVKLFKKKVQPLEVRRAKPAFVLCRGLQKATSKGLIVELSKRCVYAYHNADMEPQCAVGWVLDNFPQEIQYDLIRNYRDDMLLQMGEPLEGDMDEFFTVHLESLACVLFPQELHQAVNEVIGNAMLEQLRYDRDD